MQENRLDANKRRENEQNLAIAKDAKQNKQMLETEVQPEVNQSTTKDCVLLLLCYSDYYLHIKER